MIELIIVKNKYDKINEKNECNTNVVRLKNFKYLIGQKMIADHESFNNKIENSIDTCPRFLRKNLNSLKNNKNITNRSITDNGICYGSLIIANLFAQHFSSVFETKNITNYHQQSEIIYLNQLDGLQCIEIHSVIIAQLLLSILNKYSVGLDVLPLTIIKIRPDALISPLHFIFNLAVRSGTFPNIWENSKVLPIPKKGNHQLVENNRRVSILPVPPELFEKGLDNIILSYFSQFLTQNQHGFTPKRSTATNLPEFSEYIMPRITNKIQVDVIYTDM